jgi:hypothetical protein
MGNAFCPAQETPEQKLKAKQSRALDVYISGEAHKTRDEVKLLLLGMSNQQQHQHQQPPTTTQEQTDSYQKRSM